MFEPCRKAGVAHDVVAWEPQWDIVIFTLGLIVVAEELVFADVADLRVFR